MKPFLTLLVSLLTFSGGIQAQTWTGALSSDWFTAGNWNPASVPGTSSAVTIQGSLSTYPTLTGNVTIAGLTMSSGSALNLAGYTFTDNGNVSLTSATINGGGAFNVTGAGSIYIAACTLTTALSVTGYTGSSQILDNTITGNTVISDAAAQNSGSNWIDGNLITGNLNVTHASATDEMSEGFGSSLTTGNHITGNASFTISGAGQFQAAYSHPLTVDGNLSFSRTSSTGNTFISGQFIANILVGGTFSASCSSSGNFTMSRVKNGTAGGTISVSGAGYINIQRDTLKATVGINNYTGIAFIYDNSFTGAVSISDAAAQNNSANWIDGNLVTGNLNLTHASATAEMMDGYGSPSANGNHITGNAVFTISGAGQFQAAYNHKLTVDGNLSINRSSNGNTLISGQGIADILVGGTFSVSCSSSGSFVMTRVKNNTAGGTVSVTGAGSINIQKDSLKATVGITGYTGSAYILDNSFTGMVTIADDPAQNTIPNYIDGNLITGSLNLTHASATAEMVDGYGSPSGNGNHITGNAVFTLSGAGQFQAAYSHKLTVDGNLSINRTSLTGNTLISGQIIADILVGGTFSVSSASSGAFVLARVKNITSGGSVSIANASSLTLRSDTLKGTIGLTGYTGTASIIDNSFTGAVTISDAPGQNSHANYIDGNLINGNLSLTHASTAYEMVDGYGSAFSIGNHITGNVLIALSGAGQFQAAYSHPLTIDGSLSISRNSSSGNTLISGQNIANVLIGGSFSLNSVSTGQLTILRTKNSVAGGSISVANAGSIYIQKDTLAADLNITDYTGALHVADNTITGNTFIADAGSQNNSTNYIDGNRFAGAFTLVHSSASSPVYDGYGSAAGNGNVVSGKDSIVNKTGAAAIIISNSHIHEADSDFVLNAASGVSIGSLRFGGGKSATALRLGAQPISIGDLYLAKSGNHNLSLLSTVSVTSNLFFSSGQITAVSAPLVFASGATHSGAASGTPPAQGTFVTGTVYKAGNQAFTFPLGYMYGYNPAGISAPVSGTDTFSAQYIPFGPHPTYDSSLHDASINHISKKEYWLISRVSGSSNVSVTLGYNGFNSGSVTDMSKLVVAHWFNNGTSTSWHNEGNGGTTGTNTTGSVTTNSTVSSFSPFTLASTTIANPLGSPGVALPVQLVSFDAKALGRRAQLSWRAASEEGVARYEVERSGDGLSYQAMGSTPAKGLSSENAYEFYDDAPFTGANYYRLITIGADGSGSRSAVRMLRFEKIESPGVAAYPNPANDVLHVTNIADRAGAMLTVRNSSGQLLYRSLLTGQQETTIATQSWPAGIYFLNITGDKGSSNLTFIRK